MTTILWLSRHEPLPAQIAALRRLFGQDVEVRVDPRVYVNAEEVARRFGAIPKPRELVFVGPISVLQHLCQSGMRPLWAQMETTAPRGPLDPSREVDLSSTRRARFVKFLRVVGVEIQFEEVEPT
jgi:hypothetical protein